MSIDLLENQEDVIPIYDAFGRSVPKELERPERAVEQILASVDGEVRKLEALASQPGAEKTAKRAAKIRERFNDLEKRALKEMGSSAKKDEATKKLEKITKELLEFSDEVSDEVEVPVFEQTVSKALAALRKRDDAPQKKEKIAEFEKRLDKASKEDDPKKRCNMYFNLQRDIVKSDLAAREAEEPGSTWQDQVEIALQDAKPGKKRPLENMSDQEFLAMKKGFENSFAKKIEDLAFTVPKANKDKFLSEAGIAMATIGDETFVLQNKPKDQQALGKLLVKAQTRALQELSAVKRRYPPDVTPQARTFKGKIVITKAAPKTESLVMQGGGGKGSGYPPMLEEMNKSGMLKDVKLLVGTSIGALNASCLACGGLADERQILDLGITKQAYDPHDFKKQYPGITFEPPVKSVLSELNPKRMLARKVNALLPSCAGEMAKMDQLMSASVAEGVKNFGEDELASTLAEKVRKLDDETLARMGLAGADDETIEREVKNLAKKVKNQDFKSGDRTAQMITFKDLAILHQLDPTNFKELCITGWEGTGKKGKEVYFNAKDFPDMPVALAARISMGLPVFSPLYWNDRGPFFDGGLGSNSPVEATPGLDTLYTDKDGKARNPADVEEDLRGDVSVEIQEAMAKTTLMTFDDEGKGDRNLYGEGRKNPEMGLGEKITLEKTGIKPGYKDTLESDARKVYNTGVNTLQAYHGDLGTLSLGPLAKPEAIEYAETMSRLKSLEQLDARQDQVAEVSCTNTDEALLGMTTAEKRKFVAAGKPQQGGDRLLQELYDKCEQCLVLEDAADNVGDDSLAFLDLAASSPLCAAAANQIAVMRDNYSVHVKGDSTPEALKRGIEAVTKAIAECPAFLRPLMKKTVLLPMQQRRRRVNPNKPFDFAWQQVFSADAFHTTMNVAVRNQVLDYLPVAVEVRKALAACEKSKKSLDKATSDNKKPKEVIAAARKSSDDLYSLQMKLREMGKAAAYQRVPTMQQYINWMNDSAATDVDRVRAIVGGRNAVFPAADFEPWDNKDWQAKKKLAIENGVLQDPGSTGFSSLFEKAEKASTEYSRAAGDKKEKAGKIAWNAWDKVVRMAKHIQGMSENAEFTKYLEGAIKAATEERGRFQSV